MKSWCVFLSMIFQPMKNHAWILFRFNSAENTILWQMFFCVINLVYNEHIQRFREIIIANLDTCVSKIFVSWKFQEQKMQHFCNLFWTRKYFKTDESKEKISKHLPAAIRSYEKVSYVWLFIVVVIIQLSENL